MNTHIHIGIDPDTDKSGVAIWDSETKTFDNITTMRFWDLIEDLETWTIPIMLHIEAGWNINKSNWHISENQTKQTGENIAKKVGRNHQVGILLEQYCIKNNIQYRLVNPMGKINAKVFKDITKRVWDKDTNQEMRDAAMLVYNLK